MAFTGVYIVRQVGVWEDPSLDTVRSNFQLSILLRLPQSIPESLISLVKAADDHQLSEEDEASSPDVVNGDHLFFCLTDVKLPPEQAEGVCSQALQEKIFHLMETKRQLGFSSYDVIVKGKSFRNPSIYEKLIQMCDIEEFGSNYSKKSFDPKEFQKEEFYEKLVEVQRKAHESKQKSRGNIEFKSGTKILAPTKPVDSGGGLLPLPSTIIPTAQDSQKKRKSKWDNPSSSMNVSSPTSTDPVVGAQALANARLIDKNLIKLFKQ
uniref:Uncharacterized protein n=1 Tax=Amphimedon queenslandica TaxID=400682 RepID=A0A1X7VH99_AMPQE